MPDTYISLTNTPDDVRAFWPILPNSLPVDPADTLSVDTLLTGYIQRAEMLINSGPPLNTSDARFPNNLKLAGNLVVRNLVWADAHPAAQARAAGLQSENGRGLAYTMMSRKGDVPLSLHDLIGDEAWMILQSMIDTKLSSKVISTQIFEQPWLVGTDADGNQIRMFDLVLDAILKPTPAEFFGFRRRLPYRTSIGEFGPFPINFIPGP